VLLLLEGVGLGNQNLPLFLATNEMSLGGDKKLGVFLGTCWSCFLTKLH
jgi:hypothetical protein